ncbi:MAG: hypothetical protein R3C04_07740 [Hyphomonas sp.]
MLFSGQVRTSGCLPFQIGITGPSGRNAEDIPVHFDKVRDLGVAGENRQAVAADKLRNGEQAPQIHGKRIVWIEKISGQNGPRFEIPVDRIGPGQKILLPGLCGYLQRFQ